MKSLWDRKALVVFIWCLVRVSSAFVPIIGETRTPHLLPAVSGVRVWRNGAATSSLNLASVVTSSIPRISEQHVHELATKEYVVVPDFLPADLQEALREDVSQLRSGGRFKIAKIGQDSSNSLNTRIRVAQTCFIGGTDRDLPANDARSELTSILQQTCLDMSDNPILQSPKLDNNLSELLYAYYPQGGFYRRHRDAIPGSASVLRTYSLLLYLNTDWTDKDGGCLRMHMDLGGDELPPGEEPNFLDVEPKGGTLVLFKSDKIPHEVLDTQAERLAVVGWYNKELTASDIADLGVNPVQLGMLAVAAALVTLGLVAILSG